LAARVMAAGGFRAFQAEVHKGRDGVCFHAIGIGWGDDGAFAIFAGGDATHRPFLHGGFIHDAVGGRRAKAFHGAEALAFLGGDGAGEFGWRQAGQDEKRFLWPHGFHFDQRQEGFAFLRIGEAEQGDGILPEVCFDQHAVWRFSGGQRIKCFARTGKQIANAIHIQNAAAFMGAIQPASELADHAVA
jgi:hypothetical protein